MWCEPRSPCSGAAAQVYYGAQGMMSVSLPGGGGPPQVQAPRGQHTYPQGAPPPQLQPRQKHVLEIKDPTTGRNILEDINNAAAEPSPPPPVGAPPLAGEGGEPVCGSAPHPLPSPLPAQEQPASDIAGMFAAQVAAAASSGPPVKSCPPAAVLEASPPPSSLEEGSPPPPPGEEEEEEEVLVVAAAPEDRREPSRSSSPPPPALPAVADERGPDVVAPGGIPAEPSVLAAPPPSEAAALGSVECTGPGVVESVVVAAPEVAADSRNSEEQARTAVVVEEAPARKEPAEETTVAAPAETTTTTREAADSGESLVHFPWRWGIKSGMPVGGRWGSASASTCHCTNVHAGPCRHIRA